MTEPSDGPGMPVCVVTGCEEDSVYRTWFEDCEPCRAYHGTLFCLGHSFCCLHTAEVRTGDMVTGEVERPNGSVEQVPDSPLYPARVCGVT